MSQNAPVSPRRRRLLVAPFAAVTGLLLSAGPAFADWWSPESGGSPNADEIDTLYKLIFVLGAIIFVAVEGALLWSFFKFRARKGRVAAQVHGNTRLEVGWTVAAALILVFLTVVTFIQLPDITNPAPTGPGGLQSASRSLYATTDQPTPPGDDYITIRVDGQQYVWRYQYPGDQEVFAYEEMVVPADTTVVLELTADDVIHSWWIPELGPKADAVPGYVNKIWFKAREGVYAGQCAELCGRNHANMLARVRAVPPEEYEAWLEQQATDIREAEQEQARQREQFEQPQIPDEAQGDDGEDIQNQGQSNPTE